MNITTALNEKLSLIPKADFLNSSQETIVKLIFKKHGENYLDKIKLIDENDDCDTFLVEIKDKGYCLKISFDQVAIFYEYMVLKGIEHLRISPIAFDRNQIEFSKTIYYTISSFEFSENLLNLGSSLILDDKNFNYTMLKMHKYEPPKEVWPYLDDTKSFLEYEKINFENITQYIDSKQEEDIFNFIHVSYNEVLNDMLNLYENNKNKINLKKFVHGKLTPSTIITNSSLFKFINFENSFIGSPFFDLSNLVFEMQMTGLKEYDFVTKKIKQMNLIDNRFNAPIFLEEYKQCKKIWYRKKFLDIIKNYIKEVLILNKNRPDKLARLGSDFTKNFYRFYEIEYFFKNKDIFAKTFSDLFL